MKDNIGLFLLRPGKDEREPLRRITLAGVPRVGDYIGLEDVYAVVTQVVWARDPGGTVFEADVFATAVDSQDVHRRRRGG
jgi:hypothetical protein